MSEWYWYIANNREIFVDLDHPVGGPLRRLTHARARLLGSMAKGKLDVTHWYLYTSSPWHYHMMVHTVKAHTPLARTMWEARLADDGYRHLMSIARLVATVYEHNYSLLISPRIRSDYYRPPDYACKCPGKHRGEVMARCPIAAILGSTASLSADHFGSPVYTDEPFKQGRQ